MMQLRITLESIKPDIWRRIITPADITLDVLHLVIQGAMGWRDCHLHEFEIAGSSYEAPDSDDHRPPAERGRDETQHQLGNLVKEGDMFSYVYDFGNDWRHRIEVEALERTNEPAHSVFPVCLAGERACPPEDCGGPYGYDDFLEALTDPSHEEHEDVSNWAGSFQPELFSVAQADALVGALYQLGMERRART